MNDCHDDHDDDYKQTNKQTNKYVFVLTLFLIFEVTDSCCTCILLSYKCMSIYIYMYIYI